MFSMQDAFFYISSTALLVNAIFTISSSNAIFSLLFLVGSFVCASLLLFLLECEFLALIFLLVYVGAIAILFLFAVMMLEAKSSNLSKNSLKHFPMGLILGIFFLFPLLKQISVEFSETEKTFYNLNYINWYDLIDSTTDIEVLGELLYSYYVLHFLIAGLILLLVLIGVVYLTNNYNTSGRIEQSDFKQLARDATITEK